MHEHAAACRTQAYQYASCNLRTSYATCKDHTCSRKAASSERQLLRRPQQATSADINRSHCPPCSTGHLHLPVCSLYSKKHGCNSVVCIGSIGTIS